MKLLEARNVSLSYKHYRVLKKVSFSINQGEVVAIVGESGSGKTTLLRAIQGLLDISSGALLFKGNQILGPSEKLVAGHDQIATVFQDFQLQEGLTAEYNVQHELIHYPLSIQKKILKSLLKKCDMMSFRNKFPKEISGGMRQKVALAKALVNQPHLILMDEPFSNLDAPSKDSFKAVIENFKADGVSFLYVTHDVNDAIRFSDRIIVLEQGKITMDQSTNSVFQSITSIQTAKLFGLDNLFDLKTLQEIVPNFKSEYRWFWITPESIVLDEEGVDPITHKEDLGNLFRYEVNVKGIPISFYTTQIFSANKIGINIIKEKIKPLHD